MDNNSKNIDFFVRLAILGLLAVWCFVLLRPFIAIVLWGAILAIALFPVFLWLKARLGGRSKLAATLLTLLGIAIVVGPMSALAAVLVANAQDFYQSLTSGQFAVPPPPANVATWPAIGKPIYQFWQEASVNLGTTLAKFKPQLEQLAKNLLILTANTGLILLKFLLSMIIAGVLFLNAEGLRVALTRLLLRLTPDRGEAFLSLAAATIRSVARGVVGVSFLQGLLVGLGFVVAGIPAAGLLAVLCLFLSLIQVGPALVVLPTLIYAWTTMSPLGALLLTVWTIPAMLVDNVLKPLVMSRGLPVPVVVIFIGVIGGTLAHGILGLFVGPVILSLGYELIKAWIDEDSLPEAPIADLEKLEDLPE